MKTLEKTDAISLQDRELLIEVAKIVHQDLPDATILLYGSAARGTRQPDSDYDILVLTDHPLAKATEDRIEDAIFALELDRETLISTTYYTAAEWNDPMREAELFHQEVEKDAIAL